MNKVINKLPYFLLFKEEICFSFEPRILRITCGLDQCFWIVFQMDFVIYTCFSLRKEGKVKLQWNLWDLIDSNQSFYMKSKHSTSTGARLKFTLLFIFRKSIEKERRKQNENGKQSCFATLTTKAEHRLPFKLQKNQLCSFNTKIHNESNSRWVFSWTTRCRSLGWNC